MPNRLVREGILDSDKINKLSTKAENFFFRLMLCADDYGRFDGRAPVIKSRTYPLKMDMKVSEICKLIDECVKVGLLWFYEVEGKPFIEIIDFNQRLRAKYSKYPEFGGHTSDISQSHDKVFDTDVGSRSRSRREVEEKKGSKDSPKVDITTESSTKTVSRFKPPPCLISSIFTHFSTIFNSIVVQAIPFSHLSINSSIISSHICSSVWSSTIPIPFFRQFQHLHNSHTKAKI